MGIEGSGDDKCADEGPRDRLNQGALLLVPLIQADSIDIDTSVALGSLYELCSLFLLGYLVRLLRDRHEAEDVFHEVFLKVQRALPSYTPDRPFSAWILRIAKNHVSDLRAVQTRQEVTDPERMPGLRDQFAEKASENLGFRVNDLTEQLPPAQRQALFLRFSAGMRADEASAIMGISPNSVRQLQHRGLNTLRVSQAWSHLPRT